MWVRGIAERDDVAKGHHVWRDSIQYRCTDVSPLQIEREVMPRVFRKLPINTGSIVEVRQTYLYFFSASSSVVFDFDAHPVGVSSPKKIASS